MSTLVNKTKTYNESKRNKICAEGNTTYEISWLYTTNRSGDYEYLYTGKEQGKDYFDQSDKSIKAGDRVIFKNQNHQNNKVKAKVVSITSPLSKIEAAAKGVSQDKFAKVYKLKFINPPVVNGKQIKNIVVNKSMLIEKIPHHKDYICVKKSDDLEKKIKTQMKKTFLTEKFYKSAQEKQKPFIIEKVLARETSGKKVLDLDELVEPTNNYIIQKVNFKSLGKRHKSKRYSNDKNEYYRIKVKIHLMLKNTDSTIDISNITGIFSCDYHKQQVADIFNGWRNDSYTYMTSFGDKIKANRTRKNQENAATNIQKRIRGRQTRKRNNLNRKKRTRGARNIQKFIRGRRTRKRLGSRPNIKRDKALFSQEKKRNDEIVESKQRTEESEREIREMEDRLARLRD
jgi:hypothetical protein